MCPVLTNVLHWKKKKKIMLYNMQTNVLQFVAARCKVKTRIKYFGSSCAKMDSVAYVKVSGDLFLSLFKLKVRKHPINSTASKVRRVLRDLLSCFIIDSHVVFAGLLINGTWEQFPEAQ